MTDLTEEQVLGVVGGQERSGLGRIPSAHREGFEYVHWRPEDVYVTLDGQFTPLQLRAIAQWMETHSDRP
jgi:hypothetical protein